jgi:thiamine transport system ATP-binding protein
VTGLSFDLSATFSDEGTQFTVRADLDVAPGETLVVLGPSGSGKTLLLETLAGFHPHEGTVERDDVDISEDPPEDRDFGFVFQDYALFPHLSVRDNVAFGLRYRDSDADPDDLLADLGVSHLAERSPRTLSGGEKQRVALARALAVDPAALLLDEPLSALDAPTRQSLRTDLAGVLDDVTAVYVTHDRTTARALADRIAVMSDGEVVQVADPETVFERPASAFVARFVGANVCSPATLGVDGDAPTVAVRPERVRLVEGDAAAVERVTREDAAARVTLSVDGDHVEAFVDSPPAVGSRVGVAVDDDAVHSLDK